MAEFTRAFQVFGGPAWQCVPNLLTQETGPDLLTPVRTHSQRDQQGAVTLHDSGGTQHFLKRRCGWHANDFESEALWPACRFPGPSGELAAGKPLVQTQRGGLEVNALTASCERASRLSIL